MKRRLILVLVWALGIAMQGAFASAGEDALFAAVAERLSHMRDVAHFKSIAGRPIEDRAREEIVLDAAVASAVARGLDAGSVRAFFRAQIDAAKIIQYRYRAAWLADPSALGSTAPDLATDIRPALTRLGDRIIEALAARLRSHGALPEAAPAAWASAFDARPTTRFLDESDRARLYGALRRVRLAD